MRTWYQKGGTWKQKLRAWEQNGVLLEAKGVHLLAKLRAFGAFQRRKRAPDLNQDGFHDPQTRLGTDRVKRGEEKASPF